MTVQVPSNVYGSVQPVAQSYNIPTALWEDLAYVESGFNEGATGDNGTSFGLFQLHIGGQLPSQYNNNPTPVFDPTLNAQIAFPAISSAWQNLQSSFNPTSLSWWEQFAAQSGHPGGSPGQTVTDNEAVTLMQDYNLFNSGNSPTPPPTSTSPGQCTNGAPWEDCSGVLCNTPVVGFVACPCCVGQSQVTGNGPASNSGLGFDIYNVGITLIGAVIAIIGLIMVF